MSIAIRACFCALAFIAAIAAAPAEADGAEVGACLRDAEPYHTEALWAAEEIKKRTDGKYEIGVFPASQLGNENQINEALGLGTVDIIYTGALVRGLDPQAAGDLRRAVHAPRLRPLEGLSRQQAVPRSRQGLRGQDEAQDHRAHLLRRAAWSRPTRRSRSPTT